jgi:UDP-glucose 4-epimerase
MNILVTGGLGYIGSHICIDLLLHTPHNVIVIDNINNANISTVDKIQQFTNKPITFVQGDIRNTTLLNNVFKTYPIDKVIHLAALKNVKESVENPLLYYDNNVSGTINLLQAMQQFKVNSIIFSSSSMVYKAGNNLKEDDELLPVNPYGHSKLITEQILKTLNINCVILRYFKPIGHYKGFADLHGANLVPQICQHVLNNTPLYIYGDNYDTLDHSCYRDYVHVIDVARAHVAVLSLSNHHVYNIGTGLGTSVFQLINAMEHASGKTIQYTITDRRPGDVDYLACNIDKIKNDIGWEPLYNNILDICQDIVKNL